ncbi:MAG TPA: hypothetical protein VGU20_24085 [Stellaceae bacterium]|nr:hypothetical protein [Stellaceae bacterium]
MAGKKKNLSSRARPSGASYSASIGAGARGSAAVAGVGNKVSVGVLPATARTAEGASAQREIAEIKRLLAAIVAAHDAPGVTHRLDEAANEMAKEEPDKKKVGSWVKTALELAQEGEEFTETASKIAPHVTALASWLGAYGAPLLSLIGIPI